MTDKTLTKKFEEILNQGFDKGMFPYQKGNSIRIKNYIIRKSKTGYRIFDCEQNIQVVKTFSKASAIAIAKNLAQGKNIISQVMYLDNIIEKNYNDALFFRHFISVSKDKNAKEVREIRLVDCVNRTKITRRQLDNFIF